MGVDASKPSITGYTITVETGDRLNTGADSNVRVILYDEEGNSSDVIPLDVTTRKGFERGCVDTFNIQPKSVERLQRMGKISRIDLWKDSTWFASDWFVDKIVVEDRLTKALFMFPVLRWIRAKHHYQIQQLDTSLPQQDGYQEQRKKELDEKRQEFTYFQPFPNGPVLAKSLPSDECFSFNYKWDILKAKVELTVTGKLELIKLEEFDSLAAIESIYTHEIFHRPKGLERWRNDFHFGLQRVTSLNPSVIRLVTSLPKKFPVTDKLVGPFLEGLKIEEAIASRRLFICDLEILDGVPVKPNFKMCAPIGLFFLDQNSNLIPVAIQLFQKPGSSNPIFTPSDQTLLWMLVKMWYNNADAFHHQVLTHIGYTHYLMESITVCTHRNISPSHPIFKLLAPHFLYIIAVNKGALEVLLAEGGWVDKIMTCGVSGFHALAAKGLEQWRMDVQGTLPQDLKERGLDDQDILSSYHYRNDAILIYNATKKYVKGYIDLYYPTHIQIREDTEIQSWANEMVQEKNGCEGGLGLKGVPGDGKISSSEELIQICTSIIFTCSTSHACVNFLQYEEYGFPPNYPLQLTGTPPISKSVKITEKDIVKTLPNVADTIDIMVMTKLMSLRGTKCLGDFEVQYVHDPKALEVVEEFRRDLRAISKIIRLRNKYRHPPYNICLPELIPNSISI